MVIPHILVLKDFTIGLRFGKVTTTQGSNLTRIGVMMTHMLCFQSAMSLRFTCDSKDKFLLISFDGIEGQTNV